MINLYYWPAPAGHNITLFSEEIRRALLAYSL
jgi:hypothetical protein